VIRPGQLTPNEFENAILEGIALKNPSLRGHLNKLHVLSREFTGVGNYTNFRIPDGDAQAPRTHLGLDALIVVPNVENGMGAVLPLVSTTKRRHAPDGNHCTRYGDLANCGRLIGPKRDHNHAWCVAH
jgi:hypothetical protein